MHVATESIEPPVEQACPLKRSAKLGLVLRASGMIALCYLFSLITIIALASALVVEVLLGLVLLRFGLLGVMANVAQKHAAILRLFVRSLWIGSSPEYRIALARGEAPRLFETLDRLAARLKIPLPREVLVEMNVGAWVELRGWRRGSTATRLGIGYELLAGLDEHEAEAVLAHEMVHARLVRRGIKRWLGGGIARMANLTRLLRARADDESRAKQGSFVTNTCLRAADACTRKAARLVAAYSRQDEFEADRGAAELCCPAALASALHKLRLVSAKTARLGWHERIARLQRGSGYSAWLLRELQRTPDISASASDEVTDPYSTHPSIRDRIAALPEASGRPISPTPPAVALLAAPDDIASRMVAEIDRVVAVEETKDLRRLRGIADKVRGGAGLLPLQILGVVVSIIALLVGIVMFAADAILIPVAIIISGLGIGLGLHYAGRYRDTFTLPHPTRAQIREGIERLREIPDLDAADKALIEERARAAESLPRASQKEEFHRADAYDALARADYLRAHVSARLGLRANNKSVPCALALAVAAGAAGQPDTVGNMLRFVRSKTGIDTPSTLWGAAWAFHLVGDLTTAEALLVALHKKFPHDSTVLQLLAECAAARGKRHASLAHARAACASAPGDRDAARQLFELLVDFGYSREADAHLATIPSINPEEPDLANNRVRLHLLKGDSSKANELAHQLLQRSPINAPLRVQLAVAYEGVREDERAEALYREAISLGHYPRARLALGRLAARAQRADEARAHLLAALDTKRPLGPKSPSAISIFGEVLNALLALRGTPAICRAWTARFARKETLGPLAGVRFVVFARTQAEGEADVAMIRDALLPGHVPALDDLVVESAPSDRQPAGLVVPGVQYVWN